MKLPIECKICGSLIDAFPAADPKKFKSLKKGEGIYFICGVCKEKFAQAYKCPKCSMEILADFTENDADPNNCLRCGKVKTDSIFELLPVIKKNNNFI